MSQPEWVLVHSTDDTALYTDSTGVYAPELMVAQTDDDVDDDEIEATAAYVYRFSVDRMWVTADDAGTFLCEADPSRTDLPYSLRAYKPWFANSLGTIADAGGTSVADLTAALCCDDPVTRAEAYLAIGQIEGFSNFDSEPQEWLASEFDAWPNRGVALSSDERDEFTAEYIACAMWCGVQTYRHDESCPCHEPSSEGDAYDDADACECEPELVSRRASEGALTEDARKTLTDDAHSFYALHAADLRATTRSMSDCGHDFWCTRNRQGVGFWDRKHISVLADAALDRLTESAHECGEMSLELGSDQKVRVM